MVVRCVRHVSGVLFSMVVRWQVSGMCHECVRSVVLYGSEMAGVSGMLSMVVRCAGVRHVSGVLFSMVVRWQVSGVQLFSMVVRWQVSGWHVSGCVVLHGSEMAGVRNVSGVLFSM